VQAGPLGEAIDHVRRLIWTAYVVMVAEGFLVYAVGFITPFVRDTLHVEPWLAAMPNSLMAVGLGLGGAVARRLNARFGAQRAIRAWLLLMSGAGLLLATPVSILVTMAGGFLFGVALGGWLVHVNSALGQGPKGGLLLTRANLWSVVGGLIGPLVLSAAAATIGWWYGTLVPLPFLVVLAIVIPGSPAHDAPLADGASEPPLSRAFWLSWAFLTLCIGAEFSYVVWGSQVASARTGISTDAATGLASLYVVGMVGGRLAASFVRVGPERSILVLRAGTALTALGALIVWLAPNPELAGLGLFLGGLGMAPIYPFAASLALAHAPNAPVRASARLTLASSSAIFAAPLLLGVAVSVTGIIGAWAIVLALLAAAYAVVLRISAPAAVVEPAGVLPG
jgi:MFS family permease